MGGGHDWQDLCTMHSQCLINVHFNMEVSNFVVILPGHFRYIAHTLIINSKFYVIIDLKFLIFQVYSVPP